MASAYHVPVFHPTALRRGLVGVWHMLISAPTFSRFPTPNIFPLRPILVLLLPFFRQILSYAGPYITRVVKFWGNFLLV